MESVQGMPAEFDRLRGELVGLPDVVCSKPSTIEAVMPIRGESQTFIVQTYRQRDTVTKNGKDITRGKDVIFLQCMTKEGMVRIAIPSAVADAIARQRSTLTDKMRSKAAKATAQARKDRGELPGFMNRTRVDSASTT